jgi:flavin reductase (DIM6/NTAB) family NADH-FMN oxidoreductase RutF
MIISVRKKLASSLTSHAGVNVNFPTNEKIDSEMLRLAMRQWATGVTIVTSALNGKRHGMTVSSFTSVSLVPALVLVSIERVVRTHKLVSQSGVFGVSILADEHKQISDRFAGRESELEDRFKGLQTLTLETGAPLLYDGLANFDCKVIGQHEAGSHSLFIGLVVAVRVGNSGKPLIYYDRQYRQLKE